MSCPLDQVQALLLTTLIEARIIIKRIIEAENIQVFEAQSLELGLQIASQRLPHIVLIDLQGPEDLALPFLSARLKNSCLRKIPVLVIGSPQFPDLFEEARKLGANQRLRRPFKSADLLEKIKKTLEPFEKYSVSFETKDRPEATIGVPVTITDISETGLLLECPFALNPEKDIKLESSLLELLTLQGSRIRSVQSLNKIGKKGHYLVEMNLIGLSEGALARIQETINSWNNWK